MTQLSADAIEKLIADEKYAAAGAAISTSIVLTAEIAANLAILAARHGQRGLLELLDSRGFLLDTAHNNRTPLQVAAIGGFVDCVAFLISRGADVQRRTKKGVSTLLLCARSFGEYSAPNDCLETLRLLLAACAEPNVNDEVGRTALTYLCEKGSSQGVSLLLSYGADPRGGGTALQEAVVHGNQEIIRLLLNAGADPNERSTSGFTPLMMSCVFGRLECALLLLDNGADASLTTVDGENVWSLCELHGRDEIKSRIKQFIGSRNESASE